MVPPSQVRPLVQRTKYSKTDDEIGTASIGSMVMYDAHFLSLLSQATTAMTVEAMVGHVGSFDPYALVFVLSRRTDSDLPQIHPRRHSSSSWAARGCQEHSHSPPRQSIRRPSRGRGRRQGGRGSSASRSIPSAYLCTSKHVLDSSRAITNEKLQWLGPLVSDLVHSHAQIQIELNSTTDNPLIDVEGGTIHHGGNFQAMAVTNAMEKTRLGVQQMGKLGFAQVSPSIVLLDDALTRGSRFR
jgi:phenylalanine ammonia-lyase